MKHIKSPFYLLVIFTLSCSAAIPVYDIIGDVKNAPEGTKVYLVNDHSGITEDSTIITNSRFEFKGKIPYPQRYSIVYRFNTKNYEHFIWIENKKIAIKGEWSELKNISIKGSHEQNIEEGLDEAASFFQPELNRLVNENKQDSISSLIKQLSNVITEYAIKNCNSFVSVEQLYRVRNDLNKDTLGNIITKLNQEILNSPYGKSLVLHYESHILDEGDFYKDFSANTLTGESVTVSQILKKEKPILIIFGGLGCMGQHGRSILKEFHEQYKNDITILSFVFARNRDEWINDSKYELEIPLLSDLKGDHSPIKIKYGVQATPTVYLLDISGKIILKSSGYGEYVNSVAKELIGK